MEWSGSIVDDRVFYAFGVYNGVILNNNYNDNEDFMPVGRVGFVPVETELFDQEATWSIAGSGYYSDDDFDFLATPFIGRRKGAAADTQFHLGRFDLWAELFYTRYEPAADAAYDAFGWYTMLTYYLVPEKLQALGRFETLDPNQDVSGDTTDTWTFGLTYYIKDHNLKLMLNYLLVDSPDKDWWQHKILTRVQAAF
jgi:hypothetical protein